MKNGVRVRICRYSPAAVLRISGEDALTFLQGQFTQELKSLEVGASAYGLWLNQKGKVLADSFVVRTEKDVWWAVSYFSAVSVIRERLESYIIADDVIIEDQTDAWEGVVVAGEGAGDWLAGAGGLVWQGRRSDGMTWEWLRPKGAAMEVRGAEEISADELERWRIESRVPTVPRDVGPGDLPNEAGLEMAAVSYTKGCYLGQEVMARLKAMGQVRRRLVRVSGAVAAMMPAVSALPAAVFHGEKRIGEVRSATKSGEGWIGLAMVSRLGLEDEAAVSLSVGGVADVRMEIPEAKHA